jgi:hypothetical protein
MKNIPVPLFPLLFLASRLPPLSTMTPTPKLVLQKTKVTIALLNTAIVTFLCSLKSGNIDQPILMIEVNSVV